MGGGGGGSGAADGGARGSAECLGPSAACAASDEADEFARANFARANFARANPTDEFARANWSGSSTHHPDALWRMSLGELVRVRVGVLDDKALQRLLGCVPLVPPEALSLEASNSEQRALPEGSRAADCHHPHEDAHQKHSQNGRYEKHELHVTRARHAPCFTHLAIPRVKRHGEFQGVVRHAADPTRGARRGPPGGASV